MFRKGLKIDKSLGKKRRPWTSEEERNAVGKSFSEVLSEIEANIKAENAKNNSDNTSDNATAANDDTKYDTIEVSDTVSNEAKPSEEVPMFGAAYVKDPKEKVNVKFNFSKMDGSVDPTVIQKVAQQPGVPNSNPYVMHMGSEQPNSTMQETVQTPAQMDNVQQPATHPINGIGRHKVDNPPPKKKIVEKSEPDKANVDLKDINIPIEDPEPPKQWPDAVSNPLPRAEGVAEEEVLPKFDNSAIISKYRYMADIEKLALSMNIQICMQSRIGSNGQDCGLITCTVYTPESMKPNMAKGFTIDTGNIIDRRAKMFPAIIPAGFEDLPAYPVLIPKEGEKNGKSKNVLNEQLFRDMLTGGIHMLKASDSMYTKDFAELNKYVALITMPTHNMNKGTRTIVRERLMNAMKQGVFKAVLEKDSGSRFMFKSYDKKNLTFVLTNVGVPYRYCDVCRSKMPIEIEFGDDGKTKINYLQ